MARFLAYDLRWSKKSISDHKAASSLIVTLPGWEGQIVDEEAIFQKLHDDFGYGPLSFSAIFIDEADQNPDFS